MKELSCFDCKSTKNLRAIHNHNHKPLSDNPVVSTAKVQKIWEQFTTDGVKTTYRTRLFRLQKYKKFESNSQRIMLITMILKSCFDCKSTKNLRAIHNWNISQWRNASVVSTAKVQKIWEQFTTNIKVICYSCMLFRLQKYKKFESNSQLLSRFKNTGIVVSTAKVQKIWEQFTTGNTGSYYRR